MKGETARTKWGIFYESRAMSARATYCFKRYSKMKMDFVNSVSICCSSVNIGGVIEYDNSPNNQNIYDALMYSYYLCRNFANVANDIAGKYLSMKYSTLATNNEKDLYETTKSAARIINPLISDDIKIVVLNKLANSVLASRADNPINLEELEASTARFNRILYEYEKVAMTELNIQEIEANTTAKYKFNADLTIQEDRSRFILSNKGFGLFSKETRYISDWSCSSCWILLLHYLQKWQSYDNKVIFIKISNFAGKMHWLNRINVANQAQMAKELLYSCVPEATGFCK
ncbi:MAG: hypothetical protein NTY09_08615 [bacterium]|nr:hypothetical protein [bacterium]